MYTLQDALNSLALNYLSNTSLVAEETGAIRDSAISSCIAAINSSAIHTYSRVTLRTKIIQVIAIQGVTQYSLRYIHTQRARDAYEADADPLDPDYKPYPYIIYIAESTDLLKDDVLNVISIKDDQGRLINPPMVNVDTISMDWGKYQTSFINVLYRSRGATIAYDAPTDTVLNYPELATPAIENYASYLLLTSIGTAPATNQAKECLVRYEQIMNNLSDTLIMPDQQFNDYNRFERTGWI